MAIRCNEIIIKITRAAIILSYLNLIYFSCTKQKLQEAPGEILAQVGNKTISIDEFIYRAEFTVRPQYSGLSKEAEKNVLLNNFIAEKLLALETDANNKLAQSKTFQAHIRGIKEQYMREQLYQYTAFNQVRLDTSEIIQAYRLAGREYELEYITINNDTLAGKIDSIFNTKTDSANTLFDQIYETKKGDKRKVAWNDQEIDIIHDALFSRHLNKNDVLGPIKVEENKYIIMKITDCKDSPAITVQDKKKRWDEVVRKLKQTKANAIWNEYVRKIMKGKEVKFERELFLKLADLYYSLNLVQSNEQEKSIMDNFWKNEEARLPGKNFNMKEALFDKPFFRLNDEIWTVREFTDALDSHPLVFRKKKIGKREFPKYFKLAIVDMLTDHFITKAAYKEQMDKLKIVQRKIGMWEDALLAGYQREQRV